MPQAVPAKSYYPNSPGRWVGEAQWPSPELEGHVMGSSSCQINLGSVSKKFSMLTLIS